MHRCHYRSQQKEKLRVEVTLSLLYIATLCQRKYTLYLMYARNCTDLLSKPVRKPVLKHFPVELVKVPLDVPNLLITH